MPTRDRRIANVRRDLNDLVRTPQGQVSEAKVWSNVGKFIAAYLLLHHAQYIIERWDALTILLTILVLPDLFKKVLEMKYGSVQQKGG